MSETNENNNNSESKKSKFSFNCTKCGKCCSERGPIPLVLDDILRWVKNDVVKTILPYMKFIKTEFGTIDLVLGQKTEDPYGSLMNQTETETPKKEEVRTCPFYNAESKTCVIYKNRPLSCRIYPLEYDGSQYLVVDSEDCPGIGNGTNTKEELLKMRTLSKKMHKKISQMRISMPIISQIMQPFVLQEILKVQQQAMKELEKMSPEQRKAFEEQFQNPTENQ